MVEDDPLMNEVAERAAAEERKMAADQAFADTLAKRLPPDAVEHAAIEKARRRTNSMLKGLGPFCLITGRPGARVRAAVVGSENAKRGIT